MDAKHGGEEEDSDGSVRDDVEEDDVEQESDEEESGSDGKNTSKIC